MNPQPASSRQQLPRLPPGGCPCRQIRLAP
nr:unnamed protein product [Digitaria exilis]